MVIPKARSRGARLRQQKRNVTSPNIPLLAEKTSTGALRRSACGRLWAQFVKQICFLKPQTRTVELFGDLVERVRGTAFLPTPKRGIRASVVVLTVGRSAPTGTLLAVVRFRS